MDRCTDIFRDQRLLHRGGRGFVAPQGRRQGGAIRDYFSRRVRRILPPWLATVLASCLLVGVADLALPGIYSGGADSIPRPWWLSAGQWLGNLTLTESWRWRLGGDRCYFLGHAWTLCYEEQLYAVTGIALFFAPRFFFLGTLLMTAGCAAVAMLCLALAWRCDGIFVDGHWHLFASGIAVYWCRNYASPGARLAMIASLVGLLCVSVAAAGMRVAIIQAPGGHVLGKPVVAVTFALLLLALAPHDKRLCAAKWLRPLSWCGAMCYSAYLVHYPVVHPLRESLQRSGFDTPLSRLAVVVPACTVVSIAIAWVFFHTVEKRFLNNARRSARVIAS